MSFAHEEARIPLSSKNTDSITHQSDNMDSITHLNDFVKHLHAFQTGVLNELLKIYVWVTFPDQPKSRLQTSEPRKGLMATEITNLLCLISNTINQSLRCLKQLPNVCYRECSYFHLYSKQDMMI